MNTAHISTTCTGGVIVTQLTGRITIADVAAWFQGFEAACQSFIAEGRSYKLLVDRQGYTPDHFSVQKEWKDKFFNETLLSHSAAIAFVMEAGEILTHLQQSNTKESVRFFEAHDEAIAWLNGYSSE
ncbi:hypothetical protein PA598K_00102 [Paenibacillus sp. 598K]|uniref:STAS/SEC14 domain-containing protein n=1 Tax=Paenibacillus sp. 598K TaxID=1117987 RepID=UPI000FF9B458|nr:STAS/SEC14 domain-containing protein [Paenibacillus sp. 598K]GBF71889.1 hypothetical protein PA598K_00102 [Paenibacillus sp. 598K]